MRSISALNVGLGILLVLTTFDAIVFPGLRLSVADVALLVITIFFGLELATFRRLTFFVGVIAPLILLLNSTIFFVYLAISDLASHDFTRLISGFIRPFLFVSLSILFYGFLETRKFSSGDIKIGLNISGILLSFIVILQYFGISPPMYHNNPSFGETGRFTFFSEGWRPTGLTNEASFVGIFLFLIFVALIYYGNIATGREKWRGYLAPTIVFLGCIASTSRIALLLSLGFVLLRRPTTSRIFLLVLSTPLIIAFADLTRFENILVFDGDASTIERYGSLFAYIGALLDPANFLGTGYLNSVELVNKYADPLVMKIIGERNLPAFSLPLQLIVELGPMVFLLLLFFLFSRYKRYIVDVRIFAVVVASALTGIQNFLFIYIFISLVAYDRNSRCS